MELKDATSQLHECQIKLDEEAKTRRETEDKIQHLRTQNESIINELSEKFRNLEIAMDGVTQEKLHIEQGIMHRLYIEYCIYRILCVHRISYDMHMIM